VVAGDDGKGKTIDKDVVFFAPHAGAAVAWFGSAPFDHVMDIKVVAGAPYSAQATTETVQPLADGNRIVRRNSTQIARDGQGRTRQEYSFTAPGAMSPDGSPQITMISINDPTTGVTHTLHPETRTAEKIRLPELSHVEIHEGAGVSYSTGTAAVAGGGGQRVFIHKEAAPGAGVAIAAPVPARQIAHYKFAMAGGINEDGSTEQLGKQVIEGLEVEGKRTTMTIPAGQIGNEQPIVVTNESWYSSELQVIVFSRRDDPMAGTTTYRLTNIVRAEPDPSLFEIPAEYTVDSPELGVRKFERKVPAPRKE
jgi:hypothetical protein